MNVKITKLFATLIFLLISIVSVSAQSLSHSFGLTISGVVGTEKQDGNSSSFSLEQFNFTYFPRYNFIERENSSVSIGLPIGVGLGVMFNL